MSSIGGLRFIVPESGALFNAGFGLLTSSTSSDAMTRREGRSLTSGAPGGEGGTGVLNGDGVHCGS